MNMEIQSYIGNFVPQASLHERALQIFEALDIAESSRTDYKSRIGLFLEFIQAHPFNRNSFLEFKRHLAARNDISVSTKSKYLTVARVFLKELNKQGIIPADITQNVKSFQQTKKHKKFGLNQTEVDLLLAEVDQLPENFSNVRLKAIIALLIYQGLRQVEVIRLDVEDISPGQMTALVHGKGRDDKEPIDLHPHTVEALTHYMAYCKVRSGPLFVSNSNNNQSGRLSTRSIRNIVTAFLKDLSIRNSTHGFRHYFTTKLIELFSNDLLTVAKFTRHKSVETLQVYNDNVSRKNNLPKYYEAFNK
ncbi:tyrosine-type recombinase/integrase [bacterium]|nr:tyrosine-type recombinase/integrase [bacterium]